MDTTTTTQQLPLYHVSTQFRNWRYSKDQLAHTRASLNLAAISVIRNTFEADEPGSSSAISFLTPAEEHLLVTLYISKISQLCGHFHFSEEVEATAVTYMKRFYLKNTVMDWHPKNVMLTALFLATKTTNNPISLDAFTSNIPRTSPSDVLDLEFLVAQSLGFEFAVWHSHRALWGLWLDIQSLPIPPEDRQQHIYDTALTHIRASRLSDAELIYAPSQIALACFSLASPTLAAQWSHAKAPEESQFLDTILVEIKTLVSSGHPPNVESVREVDRRLKLCKNPEKVVGSKAYNAKLAEEQQKAEEKRERKAELTQKAVETGDPFGQHLNDDDDD